MFLKGDFRYPVKIWQFVEVDDSDDVGHLSFGNGCSLVILTIL